MKQIKLFVTILLISLWGCEIQITPNGSGNNDSTTEDTEHPGGGSDSGEGEGETPEPEQPQETYYVKVAETFSDWSGDYLITHTAASSIKVFDSFNGSDKGATSHDLASKLTASGIHSNDGDPYKAVITKVGDAYSVHLTGVGYLGMTASKNSISKTDTPPTKITKKCVGSRSSYAQNRFYRWTFTKNARRHSDCNRSDCCDGFSPCFPIDAPIFLFNYKSFFL